MPSTKSYLRFSSRSFFFDGKRIRTVNLVVKGYAIGRTWCDLGIATEAATGNWSMKLCVDSTSVGRCGDEVRNRIEAFKGVGSASEVFE